MNWETQLTNHQSPGSRQRFGGSRFAVQVRESANGCQFTQMIRRHQYSWMTAQLGMHARLAAVPCLRLFACICKHGGRTLPCIANPRTAGSQWISEARPPFRAGRQRRQVRALRLRTLRAQPCTSATRMPYARPIVGAPRIETLRCSTCVHWRSFADALAEAAPRAGSKAAPRRVSRCA